MQITPEDFLEILALVPGAKGQKTTKYKIIKIIEDNIYLNTSILFHIQIHGFRCKYIIDSEQIISVENSSR